MNKTLDIKSKLLAAQARRIKGPGEISPQEVTALITEREVLLKIALKLEEQNQEHIQKIVDLKVQLDEKDEQEERVVRPVEKEEA